MVPFATLDNQWVGYDDVESIALKVQYLMNENLGGAMVWSIETDDFHGICGNGKYPLLNTINKVLNNGAVPSPNPPATTNSPVTTNNPAATTTTTSKPVTSAPITQTPPQGSVQCITDGMFPDPEDCSRFYVCDNGRIFWFDCQDELRFDVRISACNWESIVDC